MTYRYETIDEQLFIVIENEGKTHHRAAIANKKRGEEILAGYASHGVEIGAKR